jgi:hypothetical protein
MQLQAELREPSAQIGQDVMKKRDEPHIPVVAVRRAGSI